MKNYKKKYLANSQLSFQVHEKSAYYGKRCLYCYEQLFDSSSDFHTACNKRFFGQLNTPQLAYNLTDLQDLATKVIQSQMAVTGVQAKVSLSLYKKQDKNVTKKLTIVGLYGDYILKPPSEYYEQLPELESVTMHMAAVCGINVVPHSLVKLQDGTLCYIKNELTEPEKVN
jgi:serine/threonine-protein kinase HipA